MPASPIYGATASHYIRLSTPATNTWTGDNDFFASGELLGYDTLWSNASGALVDYRRGSNGTVGGATQTVSRDVYVATFDSEYDVRLTSFEAIVYRGTTAVDCNNSMTYDMEVVTYVGGVDPVSYTTDVTTLADTDYASHLPWRLLTVEIEDTRYITSLEVAINWHCTQSAPTQMYVFLQSITANYQVGDALTPLIKPLTNTDEISIGGTQYVTSATDMPVKFVHAPADSVVMGIEPLTLDKCNAFGITGCVDGSYSVDVGATYVVYLRTLEGDELVYIMSNAPAYIENEQTITGGCIMGQTVRTNNNAVSLALSSDGTTELLDRYTLAPSDEAEPCNSDDEDVVCQGGDDRMLFIFNNASKSNGVTYDGIVIRLPQGGRMAQVVALPRNERVYGEIVASGRNVQVRFGTRVEEAVLGDIFSSVVFGWHYVSPDVQDLSTVYIENTGVGDVVISDICIAFESDNPPQVDEPPMPPEPPACYFYNHDFALGDAGWAVSDTFNTSNGALLLYHESEISQSVSLYPSDDIPTIYTLTARIALWHQPPYVLSQIEEESLEMYYNIDGVSNLPFGDPVTLANFYDASVTGEGYIELSTDISLIAPIESNLIIGVDTSNLLGAIGLNGIRLTEVCLSPSDGIWHGYEESPNDGNLVVEECESPAQLPLVATALEMIPAFAYFIRDALEEFIGCTLMRAVNGVYGQVKSYGLTAKYTGDWTGQQLVPYMGGYLSNLFAFSANGLYTDFSSVYDILGSLSTIPGDFFGLVAWVIGNLFGILVRIVQNFTTILKAILEFINTLKNIANELIKAWNTTTAQAMPGIDDCQIAPETKTRCIVFWIAENTIFGEPYGFLIVPVITSALTIMALLNLFVQVRALISRVREAI
jgi:hypothetical protein